jgi:hypothetical protein
LTDVVVPGCFTAQDGEEPMKFLLVVSFVSWQSNGDISGQSAEIGGKICQALQMHTLRDQHVMLLCRIHASDREIKGDTDLDDGDGSLFSQPKEVSHTFAILIHVPTRQEIKQVCLSKSDLLGRDAHPLQIFHLLFMGDGDTVGAALC